MPKVGSVMKMAPSRHPMRPCVSELVAGCSTALCCLSAADTDCVFCMSFFLLVFCRGLP